MVGNLLLSFYTCPMLHNHYLVELEFTFRHSGSRVRLVFNSGRKLCWLLIHWYHFFSGYVIHGPSQLWTENPRGWCFLHQVMCLSNMFTSYPLLLKVEKHTKNNVIFSNVLVPFFRICCLRVEKHAWLHRFNTFFSGFDVSPLCLWKFRFIASSLDGDCLIHLLFLVPSTVLGS